MTWRQDVPILVFDQDALGGINPFLELGHLLTDPLQLGHVRHVVREQRFVVLREPAVAPLEYDRGPDSAGDSAREQRPEHDFHSAHREPGPGGRPGILDPEEEQQQLGDAQHRDAEGVLEARKHGRI